MHRITENGFFFLAGHAEGSSEEDEDGKKNEENRRQAQAPIKSDQNMIIQGAAQLTQLVDKQSNVKKRCNEQLKLAGHDMQERRTQGGTECTASFNHGI
jgi:hypothetical protein